jgi:NAD dependent epimerase/dehydratase family enzyme
MFALCPVVQSSISSSPENQRPKVFVSSSAVGYYGASQTSSFTEDSPAGNDFLAEICKGGSLFESAIAVSALPKHFKKG